jgi:hypothetical protein
MDSASSKATSASAISGKLVIVGILFVAFWAAGISWYFRYTATRKVLQFWGPVTATRIRDAPVVLLDPAGMLNAPTSPAANGNGNTKTIDVSHAPGLTHFRNALLEDHNFIWGTLDKELPPDDTEFWSLVFQDPKTGKSSIIFMSDDCRYSASRDDDHRLHFVTVDTAMAKGLREMFAEFSGAATIAPPGPAEPGPAGPIQPAAPAR